MISEILSNGIADYIESQRSKFSSYEYVNSSFHELDIASLITYANNAKDNLRYVQSITFSDCNIDIMGEVEERLTPKFIEHERKEKELKEWIKSEVDKIREAKKLRVQNKEREIQALRKPLNDTILPLMQKHTKLLRYKSELESLMKIYSIPEGEVSIDTSGMTLQEVDELFDTAIYASSQTVGTSNIKDKVIELVYLPIVKKFGDEEKDKIFKASHFLTLLILGFLLKPYFMGIVGFIYIVGFLANLKGVYERVEILQDTYALMSPMSFDRFIEESEEMQKTFKELEELEAEDLSGEELKAQEEYEKRAAELAEVHPKFELDKYQKEYNSQIESIQERVREAEDQVFRELKHVVNLNQIHIDEIEKYFERKKSKLKFLGTDISQCKTMDMKMKLGVGKFDGAPVIEAAVELPLKNIHFTYKDAMSKAKQINFMKLMLCNALCNVKEKHLNVTIFDYENIGREFSEFYRNKLSNIVEAKNLEFKAMLDGMIEEGKKSLLDFGERDIQQFNDEAERIGKVTKDYKLLIVLSAESNLCTDPAFKSFVKYSASLGIWVWHLAKDLSIVPEKERVQHMEMLDNTLICSNLGEFMDGTNLIGGFTDPVVPYEFTPELGAKTLNTLEKILDENRMDILWYEEEFRIPVIPDEKVWTYSANDGIEINFGYLDGDPSKPDIHVLGDNTVHMLMAGATGAGKSATINQMLASLLHKYSPEELEMVMIDFKNVEFSMYTGDLLIPHAKIIAGTKEGEYAISIFDYLIEEMDRRTKLFSKRKVQKIAEYNNLMRSIGKPEECLPRVLLLCDEYQVMFTEVEQKAVEVIRQRITSLSKLARFAGCHMWFTSQSMKGTMSKDIMDQFKLRAALQCSKDTSNDLIGNSAASTIKSKGYIYTNDSAGEDPKSNRFWRVPFASNDYIKEYLPRLIKKGASEGHIHRRAEFFDEDKLHKGQELTDWYNRLDGSGDSDIRNMPGLFLLGERTSFSLNRLPTNFKMLRDDSEHVLVSCFERSSMLNMANTFIANFKARDVDFIVHSADRDSITLLDLESRVPEDFKAFVNPRLSAEDLLEALDALVTEAEEDPEVAKNELYFMGIHWDKLDGVGRNESYKYTSKLQSILQRASIVNVHILLLMKEVSAFRTMKTMFSHRIVSFTEEKDSNIMIDSSKGKKIKDTIGIYQYGSNEFKFKIYQFPIYGEVVEREAKLVGE